LKERFPSSIFLLFSFLLVFEFSLVSVRASDEVIRVPSDYPTIQEAVDAAFAGGIIVVDDGIYYEHVLVNKTLTLIGQNRANTVIDVMEVGRS